MEADVYLQGQGHLAGWFPGTPAWESRDEVLEPVCISTVRIFSLSLHVPMLTRGDDAHQMASQGLCMVMERQTSALGLDLHELPAFPFICQPGPPTLQLRAPHSTAQGPPLYSPGPSLCSWTAQACFKEPCLARLLSQSALFPLLRLSSCLHL